MSPSDDRGRPCQDAPTLVTTNNRIVTERRDQGALLAESARPWFDALSWQQAIERAATSGDPFSADDLQAWYGLPDLGNGTGGAFTRARLGGLIRRVGYRPSAKTSRSGGVVAIWVGVRR